MKRRIAMLMALALLAAPAVIAAGGPVTLPTGWRLQPPQGARVALGTMPQGIALSPDGTMLAVVESGVDPAALRIFEVPSLHLLANVQLPGAFGAPVWNGNASILVAGANADAVFTVSPRTLAAAAGAPPKTPLAKDSWPAAVAVQTGGASPVIASANDGDGTATIGSVSVPVGAHPSAVAFSKSGAVLYVAVRGTNEVVAIDAASKTIGARIPVGLHPGALALSADGNALYVAESDDDSVGVIDTATNRRMGGIDVGLHAPRLRGNGASPNALLVHGGDLFVSLGAQNSVALVRGGRVVERIPAGWYPTGLALGSDGTLYIANGRGEGAPANPAFDPLKRGSPGYVGSLNTGSLRAIPAAAYAHAAMETQLVLAAAQPQWIAAPQRTVVRAHGPIAHIIYVIKENRTYDQVLGDLAPGNGDPALAMFGERITPNQHALARRFGVFDNAYTDAEVSASGHNWTDAAIANDYVERFWPPNYGGRRPLYDAQDGAAPDVPRNGYLWDAARRAHVTFRDYGEDIDFPAHGLKIAIDTFRGLTGAYDPRYVGWDLHTGDDARYEEWRREFAQFVSHSNLPQFEMVYLPNDHTAGTSPGMPTPQAYLAANDYAVGRVVQTVSRSRYWKSTAIFVLEDDAQNGPDHVSDQRSTFYIASPYAKGGIQHAHYSTSSFVHTIELILGLPPLSIYDATARPLYDAFATRAVNAAPFIARVPRTDMRAVNGKTAYNAAVSARLNFSRPDAANETQLNDILAHSATR
ncbi:MAG: bifunctional YncE family protein/alkaline phosphatase family protein [Candidatus Baltobacteraceae bacterium]